MSAPASDKLVRMANQIAAFFSAQPLDQAVAGVVEHLTAFWTPKMRREIAAHLEAGGVGLDPLTRAAVERLPAPTPTDVGQKA